MLHPIALLTLSVAYPGEELIFRGLNYNLREREREGGGKGRTDGQT